MPEKPRSITHSWLPGEPANQSRISTRERDQFYHTARWKRESSDHKRLNPLCVKCLEKEIVEPVAITDHIIPKDVCQDPWDQKNWQSLCKKHHAIKSARDKKHFKK